MFNIIYIQQIYNDSLLNQLYFISFKFDFNKKFKVEKILNSNMHRKHFM